MNNSSTLFLKGVLVLIALTVLGFCAILFPMVLMNEEAEFYRPLVAGMYIPAIPFLMALYQAFRLLTYIDTNQAFSELSVVALKNIKYCAIAIGLLFTAGMPVYLNAAERDDAPGVALLGLVIAFASYVVAVFAALLQKLIRSGLDLKAENDLTV